MVRTSQFRNGHDRGRTHAGGPREESILERVARGDESAMAACMETYRGLVLSLARRQLGRLGDVDDGLQEVFVALWRNADRFDPERGSELAFVATLAQRKLIDIRRRVSAHHRLLFRTAAAHPRQSHHGNAGGDSWQETAAAADKVLRDLPVGVQETLCLSIYRGLSYRSIAAALDAPNGTIKSWASRGLRRLRETIEPAAQAG